MSTDNLFKREIAKQDTSLDVRMEYDPHNNRFNVFIDDTDTPAFGSQSAQEADGYYTNFCNALESAG